MFKSGIHNDEHVFLFNDPLEMKYYESMLSEESLFFIVGQHN